MKKESNNIIVARYIKTKDIAMINPVSFMHPFDSSHTVVQ